MKKLLFFILCFALFLSSCSKSSDSVTPANPTPLFTIQNENNLRAPVDVKFTNISTDADSYEWTYGSSTSKDKDYSEVIYNGGTYSITLKATKGDVSKTLTKTFNVLPAYTKAKIKSISLVNVPFTRPTGGTWDTNIGVDGANPDIYFDIQNSQSVSLYSGQSAQVNDFSQSNLPYKWTLAPFYQVPNVFTSYFVSIRDKDFNGSEEIGYVSFKLDEYITPFLLPKYPTEVIRTTSATPNLSVRIEFQWEL